MLERWLPALQDAEDPRLRARVLNLKGLQYHYTGRPEQALSLYQDALTICQEIGARAGEGATLNNISQIYEVHGDYDIALDYLQQSLAIRQRIGDVAGLCATLFNMGHIHLQNEEIEQAVSAWLTVYRLAKPMQLAEVLEALVSLAEQLGLPGGPDAWEVLVQKVDLDDG